MWLRSADGLATNAASVDFIYLFISYLLFHNRVGGYAIASVCLYVCCGVYVCKLWMDSDDIFWSGSDSNKVDKAR